jgi:bifunctional DNA-binding transcriptional regulator/antitoxin component of YhaV-PrlF toxin-antitoxin module
MADLPEKPVRRVRVSKQRQINIPKDFYDALDLDDEALIEFTGKEIIIRSAEVEQVDFSVDILNDLTNQGYSGQELIKKFSEIKRDIPRALDELKKDTMSLPTINGSLDDYLDSLEDDDE